MNIEKLIYENRYNKTITNKELQDILKQYPDDTKVAVEYCDVRRLQYIQEQNLIVID